METLFFRTSSKLINHYKTYDCNLSITQNIKLLIKLYLLCARLGASQLKLVLNVSLEITIYKDTNAPNTQQTKHKKIDFISMIYFTIVGY